LKHSSLRALIAIVFAACVAIVGRTAWAAPVDSAQSPTIVAAATPTGTPTATPAPTPTPTAAPPPKVVQFSGEADLGYTRLASEYNQNPYGSETYYRVFDGITLPAASIQTQPRSIANAPDVQDIYIGALFTGPAGLGGDVDVAFGTDADVFASYPQPIEDWNIPQAYLTYAYKDATFTVGKFYTLAGAEVIKSVNDWEYSRSILFGYAVPFTHTGVRLNIAPSSKFNYTIGENLGWDTIRSQGNGRTTELGIGFNPSSATSLTVQSYIGKSPANAGEATLNWPTVDPSSPALFPLYVTPRHLYDVVLIGHVTSALTLQGNYDYGTQMDVPLATGGYGTAIWQGLAAYLNYQFTPKWAATIRGEEFDDKGGFRTGVDQKIGEGTFTAQYQPVSPLFLRLEYRADHSNQAPFTYNGNPVNFQHTLGAEAAVKF